MAGVMRTMTAAMGNVPVTRRAAHFVGGRLGRVGAGLARAQSTVTTRFGDLDYWESVYSGQKPSSQPFEWFLPFDTGLREHVLAFMPSPGRVLHLGCGTSDLGPRLAAEPNVKVHDIDASPSAVRIMAQRHQNVPRYTVSTADVLHLPFRAGSFNAALDKGTLDAILCKGSDSAQIAIKEVNRVLAPGGVFLQVSSEPPETRMDLLNAGASAGMPQPWSRTLFKELTESDRHTSVEGTSYYLYAMMK